MEDEILRESHNKDDEDGQQQPLTTSLRMEKLSRKEKRKAKKKMKRKEVRREIAEKERERENDPEEIERMEEREREERERSEREVKAFEERERIWLQELEAKRKLQKQEQEEEEQKLLQKKVLEKEEDEEEERAKVAEDENWEYVEEEGPAEIVWQGNEIIVRKKKIKVPKKIADRPTSNPLPPQSQLFAHHMINASSLPAQEALENVAQQLPNFGTEQDKAHCPFHLKTGACRFGQRCSRVHFYPDKSCTLLMKNMYNGPGLAWEQDEGLEYTEEEVEHSFEEFYEDVHAEFLKFGEIVNFKVCKNGSPHLRGNVYVHYKSLDSAVLAYQSFNGRYYAGKQLKCEFVNITRWKVAICGEYMKSRLQRCSHGTACNFIHCFRNPGGDYEWADWEKPAPRFWLRKMAALFGHSDSPESDKLTDKNMRQRSCSSKKTTSERDRYHSRRSRSRELDFYNGGSHRRCSDELDDDPKSLEHWSRQTADEEMLDRDRDGYYSQRRSSKHRKEGNSFLDHGKIQEADFEDERCHRHEEKGHHRRLRRSSVCHAKEYVDVDDNEDEGGHFSEYGERERDHNNNRRKSTHQSDLKYQDKVEGKGGSSHSHSVGELERNGDRHYIRRRKRSKSRNKCYEKLDDDDEGRKSTSEAYSSDDQSERSVERGHWNHRESPRLVDNMGHQDENRKKRRHDIFSLEEQSDEYNGRDRHHSHGRRISQHRSRHDINPREYQLDEHSDGERHHSHGRKPTKHRNVLDSRRSTKGKALDIDTIYDRWDSDRNMERHRSYKRKHLTQWDEDGALKKLKDASGSQESDIEKLNVEGSQSYGNSGHNGERHASGYNDEDYDMGRSYRAISLTHPDT